MESKEMLQIMKMIAAGKISPEEGAALIEAMCPTNDQPVHTQTNKTVHKVIVSGDDDIDIDDSNRKVVVVEKVVKQADKAVKSAESAMRAADEAMKRAAKAMEGVEIKTEVNGDVKTISVKGSGRGVNHEIYKTFNVVSDGVEDEDDEDDDDNDGFGSGINLKHAIYKAFNAVSDGDEDDDGSYDEEDGDYDSDDDSTEIDQKTADEMNLKNITITSRGDIFSGKYYAIRNYGAANADGENVVEAVKLINNGSFKGNDFDVEIVKNGGEMAVENIQSKYLSNFGSCKCNNMSADTLKNFGSVKIGGNLDAKEVKVFGSSKVEGDVAATDYSVFGRSKIEGKGEFRNITVKGAAKFSDATAVRVDCRGAINVSGRLTANEVELSGGFKIDELVADNIVIKQRNRKRGFFIGDVNISFGFNSDFKGIEGVSRYIKRIECDTITAANLKCDELVCNTANLDKRCKIGNIIYKNQTQQEE